MNHPTPPNEFPNPESQLESALEFTVAQPMDEEAINRVKNRAKNLQADQTNSDSNASMEFVKLEKHSLRFKPQPTTQNRIRFKRSFWMSAIAASLILAVGLTMLLTGKKTAFAKAMEKFHEARTLSFAMVFDIDSGMTKTEAGDLNVEQMKWQGFVAKDGRWRCQSDDFVLVVDVQGKGIMLTESMKEATILTMDEMEVNDFNYLDWFAQIKKCQPIKELGTKTLSGREIEGFVVENPDELTSELTIWIDTNSNRIAQIELEESADDIVVKLIINDIKYNVPLEESLFSMDLPPDYTISEELPDPESSDFFVEGLRKLVDGSDGVFPQSLSEPTFDLSNEKAMEGFFEVAVFLASLKKDDYKYVGAGKNREGDRLMVFWFRKNGKLKAIYSDLTVGEIIESDLPTVESK